MPAIPNTLTTMVVLLLLLSPSYAQETKKDLEKEIHEKGYILAVDFSNCAALYDSFRDYSKELGESDMAQVFNDTSNGAETVAMFFASSWAGIEKYKDFVINRYNAEYPRFRALLRHEGPENSDVQSTMKLCAGLQPIQIEVVEELRKKAYGADTSNNKWVP